MNYSIPYEISYFLDDLICSELIVKFVRTFRPGDASWRTNLIFWRDHRSSLDKFWIVSRHFPSFIESQLMISSCEEEKISKRYLTHSGMLYFWFRLELRHSNSIRETLRKLLGVTFAFLSNSTRDIFVDSFSKFRDKFWIIVM